MGRLQSKAADILDAAEDLVRTQGYNGFSFRDVARAVGIKSASVHYHFPTKANLGVALARRYTDRFLESLGDPVDPVQSPIEHLRFYVSAYRTALVVDGRMCLCGMLGAEVDSLPTAVAAEAKRFFELNIEWLDQVLTQLSKQPAKDPDRIRRQALSILATLEGAMLVARSLDNEFVFEQIAEEIERMQQPSA